jgi:hypothetical protein
VLEVRPEAILCLADGIVVRCMPEADQHYAFNTITGDHFSLNDTALWVLDSLAKPVAIADLESAYVETFGVRRTLGAKHLKELIVFSLENALVREVKP